MAYNVDYICLDRFRGKIVECNGKWQEKLNSTMESAEAITGNQNIKGNAADSIKLYIDTVHSLIQTGLMQIIQLETENLVDYVTDYYNNIDSGEEALIKKEELETIKEAIEKTRIDAIEADNMAEAALRKVSDIYSYTFKDVQEVDECHFATENFIKELDEKIETLEAEHSANDFDLIEESIAQVKAYVFEMLGKDRSYIETMTPEMLAGSAGFNGIIGSLQVMGQQLTAQQPAFEKNLKALENHDKKVQEVIAERQRKADKWKTVIGIALAVVTTVAATVVTGGVAGVAIMAGVGAITGTVGGAANEALNQWAATGGREYDMSKIGKEASIGCIKGAVNGAVGQGLKGVDKIGFVKKGLEHSNGFVRVGTRVVMGSTTSIVEGGVNRFTSGSLNHMAYEYDKDKGVLGNLAESGKEGWEQAKDRSQVISDGITGGASEASKLIGKTNGAKELENGDFTDRVIKGSIKQGSKSAATGVFDRTVETVTEGLVEDGKVDWQKVREEALDKDEIVGDLAKGTATGAVKNYDSYLKDKEKGFDLENKEYTTQYRNEDGTYKPNVRFSMQDDGTHTGKHNVMCETDENGRITVKHDNSSGLNTKISYGENSKTTEVRNLKDGSYYSKSVTKYDENGKVQTADTYERSYNGENSASKWGRQYGSNMKYTKGDGEKVETKVSETHYSAGGGYTHREYDAGIDKNGTLSEGSLDVQQHGSNSHVHEERTITDANSYSHNRMNEHHTADGMSTGSSSYKESVNENGEKVISHEVENRFEQNRNGVNHEGSSNYGSETTIKGDNIKTDTYSSGINTSNSDTHTSTQTFNSTEHTNSADNSTVADSSSTNRYTSKFNDDYLEHDESSHVHSSSNSSGSNSNMFGTSNTESYQNGSRQWEHRTESGSAYQNENGAGMEHNVNGRFNSSTPERYESGSYSEKMRMRSVYDNVFGGYTRNSYSKNVEDVNSIYRARRIGA